LWVWDLFVLKGVEVFFQVALAMLKYAEEDLLQLGNTTAICKYLQQFVRNLFEIPTLYKVSARYNNYF
jgi:hypothetical protein